MRPASAATACARRRMWRRPFASPTGRHRTISSVAIAPSPVSHDCSRRAKVRERASRRCCSPFPRSHPKAWRSWRRPRRCERTIPTGRTSRATPPAFPKAASGRATRAGKPRMRKSSLQRARPARSRPRRNASLKRIWPMHNRAPTSSACRLRTSWVCRLWSSTWGEHWFAVQGNNYFGIHYPAPFATGYMLTQDGRTRVATFASYADSLKSFVAISGSIVQGKSDPKAFATALQSSGKFGIHPTTGAKIPTYVGDVASTIHGIRSIVGRRRI